MTTNIYIYNYFTFSLLELLTICKRMLLKAFHCLRGKKYLLSPFPFSLCLQILSTTCQTQVYNCQGNDEDMNFPTPKHRETHVQLTHF